MYGCVSSKQKFGMQKFPKLWHLQNICNNAPFVSFIRLLYLRAIFIALTTWAGSGGDSYEVDADAICVFKVGNRRYEAAF
jgi:hypothetical protein